MTIKDCIDIVDNLKPNQYTIRDKVIWLSYVDETIINDVLKTHEGYDGRYDNFSGYTEDKISVTLIVPSPYDRLYTEYLKMKIDEANGETARYNNSAIMYNSYMSDFRKFYNKTHKPISTNKRDDMPPKINSVGISDAEVENIIKEVTYNLTEQLYQMTSSDKLYDIVKSYAQNNISMLKGKDGYTPIKNKDYFTEEDKEEMREYVRSLSADVSPTRSYINLLGGANNWIAKDVYDLGKKVGVRYGQVVRVNNATITPNSMVSLQISSEQMVIFKEKDLDFVTEQEDGVVTVYCIGNIPENNYTIQAKVTEVAIND